VTMASRKNFEPSLPRRQSSIAQVRRKCSPLRKLSTVAYSAACTSASAMPRMRAALLIECPSASRVRIMSWSSRSVMQRVYHASDCGQ
jgi:hypothetical protein